MKSMLRLRSLMSVAAVVLALISCSNDATEEASVKGEPKTLKVNATIDQTRTTMAYEHNNLDWSANDEIYLYIGKTAAKPNIIHPISSSTITATYKEGDNVYANYSLSNSSSTGVTQAEIKIAAEQTQSAANKFAGENLPMVAKGTIENDRVNLTFKPVGCVLVFNIYGPVKGEKIKSIKFETSVGCCGGKLCDLTAETLGYTADEGSKSVTVTLDKPAAIGTAKPTNMKIGDNQVYLVVAPVKYPAGSKFTITTTASQTYTFETTNGINCSTNTACVVNLNLKNAPELQPAIVVPTVAKQSYKGGELEIRNVDFKNIAPEDRANAEVGVYSDAELNQSLGENDWLTYNHNIANLASGLLLCSVAANDTPEERTGYIHIKCAGAQATIAITQEASTNKYFVKVTENLDDWTGDYLIVYEGVIDKFVFNGSLTEESITNEGNYINNVTITAQGIHSDNTTTNAALVRISKKEGSTNEYMLQTASGFYIYSSAKTIPLSYSKDYNTAANHPHSISIEEDGSAKIESNGSVMCFYAGSDRFRYNASGGEPIQLYKLQ